MPELVIRRSAGPPPEALQAEQIRDGSSPRPTGRGRLARSVHRITNPPWKDSDVSTPFTRRKFLITSAAAASSAWLLAACGGGGGDQPGRSTRPRPRRSRRPTSTRRWTPPTDADVLDLGARHRERGRAVREEVPGDQGRRWSTSARAPRTTRSCAPRSSPGRALRTWPRSSSSTSRRSPSPRQPARPHPVRRRRR